MNQHALIGMIAVSIFALIASACGTEDEAPPDPSPQLSTPSIPSTPSPDPTATPLPVPTPTLIPAPIVGIITDSINGQAPFTVLFQADIKGTATAVSWDLGDGGNAAVMEPIHTYNRAGEYSITLTAVGPGGSATTSTTITVLPGAPANIVLRAASLSVPVQGTITLAVKVEDEFGNEIPDATVTPRVMRAGAEIDGNGDFLAGTKAGEFPNLIGVKATWMDSVYEEYFDVTIEAGPLIGAVIEPQSVSLDIGATQQFAVSGSDQFGNSVVNLDIIWELNSTIGKISGSGFFTSATQSGEFSNVVAVRVIKGQRQLDVTASVEIIPDPLVRLDLSPSSATLNPGGSLLFEVQGFDKYGNSIQTLETNWSANRGAINAEGSYTAGLEVGLHTVSALASFKGSAITQQAKVAVGEPNSVMVELLFNGKPAKDLLAEEIIAHPMSIVVFNESTKVVPRFIGQYYPDQGIYYIGPIAGGTYFINFDLIADRLIGLNQGDFQGFVRATVAADGSVVVVAVDLWQIFALTSPVSTLSALDHEVRDRVDTFDTGVILFKWNGIPEATRYQVGVSEREFISTGTRTFILFESTEEDSYLVDLEPNAEGKFYEFTLTASNSDGLTVGRMIIRFLSTGGWGSLFRFSVTS